MKWKIKLDSYEWNVKWNIKPDKYKILIFMTYPHTQFKFYEYFGT